MKRCAALAMLLIMLFSFGDACAVEILAIGNSFTRNALRYFYPMAKSAGVEDLTVANMHISGCSLKKHFKQISKNLKSYEYYYQDETGETMTKKTRMSDVIASKDWDYIILQQTGGHSGVVGLYVPYLKYMINYVEKNATNPEVEIVWHGTWAYAKKCRNHSFARYSYNQRTMFERIVHAESVLIYPNERIDKIIPVGRAIQSIRATKFADTLNVKDGYHLNDTGCYAAALAWVEVLFGISPHTISYKPVEMNPQDDLIIVNAVDSAVKQYSR